MSTGVYQDLCVASEDDYCLSITELFKASPAACYLFCFSASTQVFQHSESIASSLHVVASKVASNAAIIGSAAHARKTQHLPGLPCS